MNARITIDDINIRAAVLRRMFKGMREPPTNERREIMARYIASDATDAANVADWATAQPLPAAPLGKPHRPDLPLIVHEDIYFMNITFSVNQSAALLAGINAPHSTVTLDIDPATLSADERVVLYAKLSQGHDAKSIHIDSPTIDGARSKLAALAKEKRIKDAENSRIIEAAVIRIQSMSVPDILEKIWYAYSDRLQLNYGDLDLVVTNDSRLADKIAAVRAAYNLKCAEKRKTDAENAAKNEVSRIERETELKAAALKREAQLAAWVQAHATDGQRKRAARGLLPESEIVRGIEEQAFSAIRDIPVMPEISDDDIRESYSDCGYDDDDDAKCVRGNVAAETATDEHIERIELIESLLPDAKCELRRYYGVLKCSSDDEDEECEVSAYGIRVEMSVGELQFVHVYQTS